MSEANDNIFGEWLKAQMKEKNMGASEFHQRARISRSALYFYVNGERTPDQDTVRLIANALGVSVETVPAFERKKAGRRKRAA
jgi:transcriptional regulator with XRE-family HTH domain